ncbi:MAG: anhydro-N-acetylmuramic acid kinase [Rubrimonas sp.]|uniref:anhydro-N-acetylmuramic acid kinase n=1 Tax=Rubrimonas sp. TaxID=2036015 RepID=UPI002FDC8B58
MAQTRPVWALGLMSGTSMDGVDAAFLLGDGETVTAFGPSGFFPYDRRELRALMLGAQAAQGAPTAQLRDALRWPLAVRAAAATATEAHARAVERLLAAHPAQPRPALIGFHGQTLVHRPAEGFTLQVGAPARLAARLGAATMGDFRAADMAAGGQGAPLVPVFHQALARRLGLSEAVAVLNIGGVANVTYVDLANGALLAFDTGPGNALLNDWMAASRGAAFDEGGTAALAGRADAALVARWLADPFFAAPPPKSLDRDRFKRALDDCAGLSVEDGAATLALYTVESVAAALRLMPSPPARWLVCGGGRRNAALMQGLRRRINAPVAPVEDVGLDGDMLEAQAFAHLAIRGARGLPTTFPATTGCSAPTVGGRLHGAEEAGPPDQAAMLSDSRIRT